MNKLLRKPGEDAPAAVAAFFPTIAGTCPLTPAVPIVPAPLVAIF